MFNMNLLDCSYNWFKILGLKGVFQDLGLLDYKLVFYLIKETSKHFNICLSWIWHRHLCYVY